MLRLRSLATGVRLFLRTQDFLTLLLCFSKTTSFTFITTLLLSDGKDKISYGEGRSSVGTPVPNPRPRNLDLSLGWRLVWNSLLLERVRLIFCLFFDVGTLPTSSSFPLTVRVCTRVYVCVHFPGYVSEPSVIIIIFSMTRTDVLDLDRPQSDPFRFLSFIVSLSLKKDSVYIIQIFPSHLDDR